MQQHELNGKQILLVEVPEEIVLTRVGVAPISSIQEEIRFWTVDHCTLSPMYKSQTLPGGQWEPFCLTEAITEEQAAELVQLHNNNGEPLANFYDYEFDCFWLHFTAKGSFASWLCSKGITGNHAILVRIPD